MKSKKIGQYFTPEFIVEFMLDLIDIEKESRILEPSCGNGIFLKSLERRGFKNCIGYEIDSTLEIDVNSPVVLQSFISADIQQKFRCVIGNPPYIRWKNLDEKLKVELSSNNLWNTYFNSLCDYLFIFILKSITHLEVNGCLVFITPEYWLNTKHAHSLREYMIKNGSFSHIIHLSETPIFENVNSSFIIFKYIKGVYNKEMKITKIPKCGKDEIKNTLMDVHKLKNYTFVASQFKSNHPWLLANSNELLEIQKYEKACTTTNEGNKIIESFVTLGDLSKIGNGLVSGLDKAFQIDEKMILNSNELKKTINVVKAKHLHGFFYEKITKYIFLNEINLSECDLKINYPNFYTQLKPYIEQLNARYKYNRDIPYWEWAFLRSFSLFDNDQPRIFVPCKERVSNKSSFRFSLIESGIFPTQDVTSIHLNKTKESALYIVALLNSRFVFDWYKIKGVIKGNIVEFSEKPLSSIPILMIDWNDLSEVELYNRIMFLALDSYSNKVDNKNKLDELFLQLIEFRIGKAASN